MKSFMQLTMLIPTFLVVACGSGESSKNPVADLEALREKAMLEAKNGPKLPEKQKEYIVKEVPVAQEQTTLTESFIKITHDKILSFYEGQTSSYKITLSVKDPGFTMKLTAKGLPNGAEFKDISSSKEPNTYEFRWKPAFNALPADQDMNLMTITLVPVLNTAKDAKKAEIVKGLSLEKSLPFFLLKNQEKPSELTITGLPTELQEGQVVAFNVVAKFPGIDPSSGQEPYIGRFEDPKASTLPTNILEMDGSRYVKLVSTKYLGDFKWEFNLVFNAKDVPVETQKTKDGKIAGTDSTQTRLILRAFGIANATPEKIVRVKIKRLASEAPAAVAVGGGK